MTSVHDLRTPALLLDLPAFEHNLRTMAEALPGTRMRPHVKAHKCTSLAKRQYEAGHTGFCAATPREIEGLAAAGLGDDLLLANETLDTKRLGALDARVTVAVDSQATIEAAAAGGVREVLIDVNVGMPRCGCRPEDAGRLADEARRHGLEVRGVMGYEGHVVGNPERDQREAGCRKAMELLAEGHAQVGGEIVSAGGTGTYDCNDVATEIQAGSYVLMDTAYSKLGLPFQPALQLLATVISVSADWAVADCGLKSLGMDHGNPEIEHGNVLFCSDEHVTFVPESKVKVGDRLRLRPAHCDPTAAYHERYQLVEGDRVVDTWPVDLRGW